MASLVVLLYAVLSTWILTVAGMDWSCRGTQGNED